VRTGEFVYVSNTPPSWFTGDFALLAPCEAHVPDSFRHVAVDPVRHERILTQLQRLRGRVYLRDGAIEAAQLSADGRHRLDVDYDSWHVVSLRPNGEVIGCARYHPHDPQDESVRLEDLGVWHSALARHHEWRPMLREAVEGEMALARRQNMAYAEVGGWAVTEDQRFTPQAFDIALSTYALAQTLGGCVGITTATVRNHSSKILRKIGGRPLEVAERPLPSYYDPQYRCDMELLRFESNAPNPKYQARMARVERRLPDLPVVCATGRMKPRATPAAAAVANHTAAHAAHAAHAASANAANANANVWQVTAWQ
jgi:hypothetical protein